MKNRLRKFLAFEWLMLLIFGLFWGAAMFFVLFGSTALQDQGAFWRNFFIMSGPYMLYLVGRFFYLAYRSIRWAYLVSNFLFGSLQEKRFAEEWLLFVILFVLWSAIMAYPLYIVEMYTADGWPLALLIMAAPYGVSALVRWVVLSTIEANKVLNEKK